MRATERAGVSLEPQGDGLIGDTDHMTGSQSAAEQISDGHAGDEVDAATWTRLGQRIALAVYGTLTVLGVLEATSFDEPSLTVPIVLITVVSTSVAIVLAHAWATVMSNRIVFRDRLTSANFVEELRFAAAFLIPTAIAVAVFAIAATFLPVSSCLLSAEGALVVLLFIVGFGGAKRTGASIPRCILIGLLDVAVGIAIVEIKELHSFFVH
jgi:hypothetical protein